MHFLRGMERKIKKFSKAAQSIFIKKISRKLDQVGFGKKKRNFVPEKRSTFVIFQK